MATIVSLEDGLRAFRELGSAHGASLPPRKAPYIMGDKPAYKSPMDRSVVEGRTAHRDHMKRHGVVEAGDMKLGETSRSTEPQGVRTDIARAIQEVRSR